MKLYVIRIARANPSLLNGFCCILIKVIPAPVDAGVNPRRQQTWLTIKCRHKFDLGLLVEEPGQISDQPFTDLCPSGNANARAAKSRSRPADLWHDRSVDELDRMATRIARSGVVDLPVNEWTASDPDCS